MDWIGREGLEGRDGKGQMRREGGMEWIHDREGGMEWAGRDEIRWEGMVKGWMGYDGKGRMEGM